MPSSVADKTLKEQKRLTEKIIEREGVEISLFRPPAYTDDGAGSMIRPDLPATELGPVRRFLTGLTMVGRGVNQQPERWFVTSQGERYKLIYVMVGTFDDDIQKGDYWFSDQGERLEVIFVHDDRRFQTKAEVILLSSASGG